MNINEVFTDLYLRSDDPEWTEFVMEYQKEAITFDIAYDTVQQYRLGQRLFNGLPVEYVRLIMAEDEDPYYDDRKIPAFLNKLFGHWTRIQAGEME